MTEQPSETTKVGKGMFDVLKGVGVEVVRGAKLTKLKAEIEKIKRIDLHAAYQALGKKAFEKGIGKEPRTFFRSSEQSYSLKFTTYF
jgi:predicted Fe-Mo cluster-binding NifX family protein